MSPVTASRACQIGRNTDQRNVATDRRQYRDHPLLREDKDVATPSSYRRWPSCLWPTETRVLAFIRQGRELGFGLEDIRALLALGAPGKASCADVHEIAAHHLDDIRSKIADLRKLERLLTKTIAQCSGSRAPDCPVVDILDVRRC
jgi:hypothetical protein